MGDTDVEKGDANEKTEFLPNLGTGDGKKVAHDRPNDDHEVKSGKSCKCCTRKCCFICTAVTLVVLGAMFLGTYLYYKRMMAAGVSSEDSDLWAKRFGNGSAGGSIGGTYLLKSYTPSYEQYLAAQGVPAFVIGLVMGSEETVIIKEPEDVGGYFTMTTKTAFAEKKKQFKIGEEFRYVWGRNKGHMDSVCTMTDPNTLSFRVEERKRGWNFTYVMEFSEFGMVDTKSFITKGIVTKKFYQREGVEFNGDVPSGLNGSDVIKVDNSAEEDDNPFQSEDAEEHLFEDSNDDFFSTDDDW